VSDLSDPVVDLLIPKEDMSFRIYIYARNKSQLPLYRPGRAHIYIYMWYLIPPDTGDSIELIQLPLRWIGGYLLIIINTIPSQSNPVVRGRDSIA
jgi:hypothetical protein